MIDALQGFIEAMPESHLAYFHPHGFGRAALTAVLRSRSFMIYGLLVEDALAACALLKLVPTGSAFIGLLVGPEHTGKGLGRFIVESLYWQASLAGLCTRSTISRHNPASRRSHQAVADSAVVTELPNDYLMIEFPRVGRERPVLGL
jgi:GNAT superfamily N-acetyltransferase